MFHPATYPSNQEVTLDEVEARALQTMIETYGWTLAQLFTLPHILPMEELVGREANTNTVPVLLTVTGLTFIYRCFQINLTRYVGSFTPPSSDC